MNPTSLQQPILDSHTSTTHLSINLALEESNSLGRGTITGIHEMTSIDHKRTTAHTIVLITVDGATMH